MANANRTRTHVSVKMIECGFLECAPPVDAVERWRGSIRVALTASGVQRARELHGFLDIADRHQTINRKGCIANPGVTIVPVACASQTLGKTARRRRHNGARGLIS